MDAQETEKAKKIYKFFVQLHAAPINVDLVRMSYTDYNVLARYVHNPAVLFDQEQESRQKQICGIDIVIASHFAPGEYKVYEEVTDLCQL